MNIFPINTICIRCNLINCNVVNSYRHDNTLFDFPLNCGVGERIVERPTKISYYPVITDTIHELSIRICDEEGKIIDFRREKISITLDFQPVTE